MVVRSNMRRKRVPSWFKSVAIIGEGLIPKVDPDCNQEVLATRDSAFLNLSDRLVGMDKR